MFIGIWYITKKKMLLFSKIRKLSSVAVLNDATEYKGGKLQFGIQKQFMV